MTQDMNITILSELWPPMLKELQTQYNCVTAINPKRDEKFRLIEDANIVILRSPVILDKETLAQAENLQLIIRAGTGLDTIDVEYAKQRGVKIIIVPQSAVSVAEHTFGLLLAVFRRIPQLYDALQRGNWEKHSGYGRCLSGKSLGLLGFGRIGICTAEMARAFRMNVLAHDQSPHKEAKQIAASRSHVRFVTIEELFEMSDALCIQLPLTGKTRGMVTSRLLGLMKPEAVLTSVARGGIVDEDALFTALRQGKMAGAALDVFATEPPGTHPLFTLENFVATPHVGGQTWDAQEIIGKKVIQIVKAFENNAGLAEFGVIV
jgi:D-3-phosphoglycerate dehydrogenase